VALTIRTADLGADRERIIQTLRQFLTPHSDAARFDWLYRANPFGPAMAWIAGDDASGETVGVAGAFPRRSFWEGNAETCWVLGDFCIHTDYRTLGPALQLGRACVAGVQRAGAAFWYDFPSDRMIAIYRRMGLRPFGEMVRYVKVLSWGRKLRDVARVPGIRTGVGLLGYVAVRWPSRRPAAPPGVALALEENRCGDAFDDLDRVNRSRFRLYLERSSAYLNWRYRDNPLGRYEFLTARQGSSLVGFAVFAQSGPDAQLADLMVRETAVADWLLDGLASLLKARGAASLSAPLLSTHPLIPSFQGRGFSARESCPVMFQPRGDGLPPLQPGDWPLAQGDRDS